MKSQVQILNSTKKKKERDREKKTVKSLPLIPIPGHLRAITSFRIPFYAHTNVCVQACVCVQGNKYTLLRNLCSSLNQNPPDKLLFLWRMHYLVCMFCQW